MFCADELSTVRRTFGSLRLDLGDMLGLRKNDDYKFLFVTDFPQFEYSEEEKRFVAMHHPFTMPYPEDVQFLLSDPERVRAQAYDVVLNGIELGSGSIRIHKQDVQRKMFEALGLPKDEIERRFGFMINAFRYGRRPTAGSRSASTGWSCSWWGRIVARGSSPSPRSGTSSCLMTGAPDFVDEEQLKVLNLGACAEAETASAGKKKRAVTIDVDSVANLSKLNFTKKKNGSWRESFKPSWNLPTSSAASTPKAFPSRPTWFPFKTCSAGCPEGVL